MNNKWNILYWTEESRTIFSVEIYDFIVSTENELGKFHPSYIYCVFVLKRIFLSKRMHYIHTKALSTVESFENETFPR